MIYMPTPELRFVVRYGPVDAGNGMYMNDYSQVLQQKWSCPEESDQWRDVPVVLEERTAPNTAGK